jgi:hypothetical protein
LEHTSPGAQSWPHCPQWALSLSRLTHSPSQAVSPVWQLTAQAPLEQTSPGAHWVAQVPQWVKSVWRFTHNPLHSESPC